MTAGCPSTNPMYQLARINHSTSSPALSSTPRSPRGAGTPSSTPTSTHHPPAASRVSAISTYAVLNRETGDRRWRKILVTFFLFNVLATFAMFAVGLWRLTDLKELQTNSKENTDHPKSNPRKDWGSYNGVPGVRYSLSLVQLRENYDTCRDDPNYKDVPLWGTDGQGDIPNNPNNIIYNSSDSCFQVTNSGNYIVYNQLSFGCPAPDAASSNSCTKNIMYSQGIVVKDKVGRGQTFELKDTWQSVQPMTTERDKICHTSRLFSMVKLLESSRVCVRATPFCLLRSGSGQSFFGLYQV